MRMPERPRLGPAELVQLTTVARRFHIDGRSKVQIAEELGLSRFKVARLLERAHDEGLVRIEIGRPPEIDTDLSEAVRHRYGYEHVVVADTGESDPSVLRNEVSRLAARHLAELVERGDVVGIAWGRSLLALTAQLSDLPPCVAVQLCGALSRPDVSESDIPGRIHAATPGIPAVHAVDASSVDVTRRVAEVSGGSAVTFYAPLVVPDADAATALRRDPRISRALRHYARLAVAVVSIGGWGPGLSTVYDALSERERRSLRRAGAVAETCGILLSGSGEPLDPGLRDRTVGVSLGDLRRTPSVVTIAYGEQKVDAVRAAKAGGVGTSLVTHTGLARRLLAG